MSKYQKSLNPALAEFPPRRKRKAKRTPKKRRKSTPREPNTTLLPLQALEFDDPVNALFISEYLKDFSAGRAAERCGMSDPMNAGPLMLRRHYVRRMLDNELAPMLEKNFITVRNVVAEIAKLAFCNLDDFGDVLDDGSFQTDLRKAARHHLAAVTEINSECDESEDGDTGEIQRTRRTRLKLYDKGKALEMLGKYLKIFGVEMPGALGGAGLPGGVAPPALNIKFVKAVK